MIEPNAILAINSLDRYTRANTVLLGNSKSPATKNYSLIANYNNSTPYSNDFQITTPGILTYGYISKIAVSQIQLQYNIPTVNFNLNDELVIHLGAPINLTYIVPIPFGFYTPFELAAITETALGNVIPNVAFQVVFNQESNQFEFTTQGGVINFYFPNDQDLIRLIALTDDDLNNYLKTYKLFGIAQPNSAPYTSQVSYQAPNFLYTPYIDIYSTALTAYQKLSDGNSSVARPKGLIARVYLSGVGAPQITNLNQALGDSPFILTLDLNTPKVMRWTRDVAINSIDFQMRDCYGDLIPGRGSGFNTEFQMTLLCVEEE